jgi:dephospho-CoA kinase
VRQVTSVALIGGIGCGKSAVAELLAAKGAAIVDADVVARQVVEVGSPTLGRLVSAFGEEILEPDGSLDRAKLASIAFAQPTATAKMNEILHPDIGVELVAQVRAASSHVKVVVVAIPLYRPEHRTLLDLDAVICVDCEPDVALERLVTQRGFSVEDATLRMAAQDTRADRLAFADLVVDNSGTARELAVAVDALWDRLVDR